MTKRFHLTIRLEQHDLLAFEAIAEARGLSVPAHLRTIIDDELYRKGKSVLELLAHDIIYGAVATRHLIKQHGTVDDLNEHVTASRALASDVGMPFEELDRQVKAQTERVAQKLNDIASSYPSFSQSERGWATIKDCRINLRLSSIMHRDIRFYAELAGKPMATFVRGLIQKDIARDHDVVNKRLARMIIYSAVACRMLQSRIGLEGDIRTIERITLRILNEMGLGYQ